jgi:hypothetical protein
VGEKFDFHLIVELFYRRLYFPSEGRRTEDFSALKNPTASAGFEPANLGTKGQHATSKPPKPFSHPHRVTNTTCRIGTVIFPDNGHIVARNM